MNKCLLTKRPFISAGMITEIIWSDINSSGRSYQINSDALRTTEGLSQTRGVRQKKKKVAASPITE